MTSIASAKAKSAYDRINFSKKTAVDNESKFAVLFQIFANLENHGTDCYETADRSGTSLSACDAALDAQDDVMALAASLPSHSFEDVAYKLALWRRDAAEVDPTNEYMERSDAVAYSAFLDLVRLTGLQALLMDIDSLETSGKTGSV